MANLQPHVVITQSPLFNQETLVSGSLETFGNDNFDLKNILISENDNLTPITGLLLKFPAKATSVINKIELPVDPTGWQAAGFYAVLRAFNKNWREDIVIDIAEVDKSGKFVHVLKASSSNPEKLELLKKELESMNQKVAEELGVEFKHSTEVLKEDETYKFPEVKFGGGRDKLFFTGKKIQLLFMMQALQTYITNEFGSLAEATFLLDYVNYYD